MPCSRDAAEANLLAMQRFNNLLKIRETYMRTGYRPMQFKDDSQRDVYQHLKGIYRNALTMRNSSEATDYIRAQCQDLMDTAISGIADLLGIGWSNAQGLMDVYIRAQGELPKS